MVPNTAQCFTFRPCSAKAPIQFRPNTAIFFFFPFLFEPQKSQIFGLFYWAVSRHWTKPVGHFYPGGSGIAEELAKSKPDLRRGWEAAGLGGWAWGLGQELAPERIITFNIGKMGAVLVEEAGGKGLQGSMGQLGRPSVDEGSCHRVLEEAGCLSGVCGEFDKTGGFFAPSSSCFYAKDDEQHRRLRMNSGYVRSFLRRASVKAVPAYCPALRRGWPFLVRGETMVVSTARWAPPQMARPFAITSMRRSSCLWMW